MRCAPRWRRPRSLATAPESAPSAWLAACGLVVAKWGVRAVVSLAPAGKFLASIRSRRRGAALPSSRRCSGLDSLAPAVSTRELRNSLSTGTRTTGQGHGWLRGRSCITDLYTIVLLGRGPDDPQLSADARRPLGFPANVVMTPVVVNEGKAGRRAPCTRSVKAPRRIGANSRRLRGGRGELSPLGGTLPRAISRSTATPAELLRRQLVIGGDYFATMGIRLPRGRPFTHDDERRRAW